MLVTLKLYESSRDNVEAGSYLHNPVTLHARADEEGRNAAEPDGIQVEQSNGGLGA